MRGAGCTSSRLASHHQVRPTAARSDQARRAAHVVAGPLHHRNQERRQRRRIGHRRARQRRHDHRGHHRHISQTASEVTHPSHGHAHDAAAQATGVHELAGQQEKRHGQQGKIVRTIHKALRQNLAVKSVDHAVAGHVGHQGQTANQQRISHWHPQGHGPEQTEHEHSNGHAGPRTSGAVSATTAWSSDTPTLTSSESAKRPVSKRTNLCTFMMPMTDAVT